MDLKFVATNQFDFVVATFQLCTFHAQFAVASGPKYSPIHPPPLLIDAIVAFRQPDFVTFLHIPIDLEAVIETLPFVLPPEFFFAPKLLVKNGNEGGCLDQGNTN